jgi:ABC-2 type transport system ATP-binding protein
VSEVLCARGLCKSYGEVQALIDVSFQASAGELVAIVGPNGAGKTTLLSILAGTQRPTSGSVNLDAKLVGWAPQQPALYSKLSVAENLELFARLERVTDPGAAVARMLEQTGLQRRREEQVGRLSGGNRQRVNVAIGLISDPPVLALDEPTAALDPAQRERMWGFICRRSQAGTTVVFSTHNLGEVQRHATRTLVLSQGRLLFDGTPAQLRDSDAGDGSGDLERALLRLLERDEAARAQEAAGA